MATVSKNVSKTVVNGSEIFVYTINVSYSGLIQPAQSGKLVDFFPDKILYQLPQPDGQLVSITETSVAGGTNVEFNFGNVNAGTSLSFTVACQFGPGRVNNDTFTNTAQLYADQTVVATGAAPTVTLQLDENFKLWKLADIQAPVKAGQVIQFRLSLRNNNDAGAQINNIVLRDVLPPQLIADTTFTPVGNDASSDGYTDTTYDGLTGNWNGNTLEFTLPSYHGSRYEVTFQVKVADIVIPGETIKNIATWTVDGAQKTDAVSTIRVFRDEAKMYFEKMAPPYAEIGKPIQYAVSFSNTGTVLLTNSVVTDTLPPEVDITKIAVRSSTSAVPSYDLYIETSEALGTYKTVGNNLSGNSGVFDLTTLIPTGQRVLSVRVVFPSVNILNTSTNLYLYGMVNDTATQDQVIVNHADVIAQSGLGEFSSTSSGNTILNGKSVLKISKNLVPQQATYYPLNEFMIYLKVNAYEGSVSQPTFADLLPLGLDYAPGNDYFVFYNSIEGKYYDSRQPNFPIPMPTKEIIKNYKNTDRTLVRYRFDNFLLLYLNQLSIYFGVVVTLNPPNTFENYGYLGNPGDNTDIKGTAYVDNLDFDGDSNTQESIVQSNLKTGTILTTSEFSLEKWVKGNLADTFTKASSATAGGDIVYTLHITNNQDMDLSNIEIVDILPYIGDTGVILNTQPRGSQFPVYATADITAKIINILGDPVVPTPVIKIEYSTSNNPIRFDENGTNTIGSGAWTDTPPADITTLAAVRVTTAPGIILKPYERLIVTIPAKAPVGVASGQIAYNSYAVRADITNGGVTTKMNPAEPNKVSVRIGDAEKGSIGHFVWLDANNNGLQEQDETGINGISVELYDADGTKLADTVTSNDNNGNPGYYSFTNLPAGNYYVKFIPTEENTLTIQKTDAENGSKPDPTTGKTDIITLAENQILTTVNAGIAAEVCAPPVISASNRCIHVGNTFDPLENVTATDCHDTDITQDIIVTANNVDTTQAGVYSVTYSVTDAKKQTTTKTIVVTVCENEPRQQAITDLFASVALEQTALSHILNAEGKKIQKAKQLNLSQQDMLKINDSVKDMTDAITHLECILQGKLALFPCDPCGGDCCQRK